MDSKNYQDDFCVCFIFIFFSVTGKIRKLSFWQMETPIKYLDFLIDFTLDYPFLVKQINLKNMALPLSPILNDLNIEESFVGIGYSVQELRANCQIMFFA